MPNALPVGTVRLMKRWDRLIQMIKVSHHGTRWERWRPLASVQAEKQFGPLPADHQVYHLDGNPLNDAPQNLQVTRSDRLQLNLERSLKARGKQRLRRSVAVQKSNRLRDRIDRSVRVRLRQFYLVCHALKTIYFHPLRNKVEAEQYGTREEFRDLVIVIVPGRKLAVECADYERVIPDYGQAWTWRKNQHPSTAAAVTIPPNGPVESSAACV